jgi:ribosomal protein L11 methyltransferase
MGLRLTSQTFFMHIQVTIPTKDFQEVLIALLGDMGYDGFEQEEDRLQAFIGEAAFEEAPLRELLGAHGLPYTWQRIEERNWNEEWEKNFQPVVVEGFCAIRAHFHPPMPEVEHELIITPKMSFGTGHHATTYMMLQAMRELDLRGKRVLDFGTGTGVLAILAERLGAASIVAIDNDHWSIENARENVTENGCTRIEVLKRDRVAELEGPFDVILANINKHVILSQLETLVQQLTEDGVILLSGLLQDDAEDIDNEAEKNNLSVSGSMTNLITRGGWICLKTGKKPK